MASRRHATRTIWLLHLLVTTASLLISGTSSEKVWSSVAFILRGETVSGEYGALTPEGANQLLEQGSMFRDRYIGGSSGDSGGSSKTDYHPIIGLQATSINNSELAIYSSGADEAATGSALAFMQGLYPPLGDDDDDQTSTESITQAQGPEFPLDGYNYPNIQTVSTLDPNSIALDGRLGCTNYYQDIHSETVQDTINDWGTETKDLFGRLAQAFGDPPPPAANVPSWSFEYAYDLWEYTSYNLSHSSSSNISSTDLSLLRSLASIQQSALLTSPSSSSSSPSSSILTIAGQTLSHQLVSSLSSFLSSISMSTPRLTLLFGSSHAPFISLFDLLGLTEGITGGGSGGVFFRDLPYPGAVVVFEMFSLGSSSGEEDQPPGSEEMYIRFLYRNSTDEGDEGLVQYPLFGRGPSQSIVRWDEFVDLLSGVAPMGSTGEWCRGCGSFAMFCSSDWVKDGYAGGLNGKTSDGPGMGDSSLYGNVMSPTVAGIIGAVVTIGVMALVVFGLFMFAGLKVEMRKENEEQGQPQQQQPEQGQYTGDWRRSYRNSWIGSVGGGAGGGFKGKEKMASDVDVTVGKAGARHERVGSWELGKADGSKKAKGRDGVGAEVRPVSPVSPTGDIGEAESGVFGAYNIFGRVGGSGRDEDEDGRSIFTRKPVEPMERV